MTPTLRYAIGFGMVAAMLLIAPVFIMCDGSEQGVSPDAGTDAGHPICDERGDGALVTFNIVDEIIELWLTDDVFIDEAIAVSKPGGDPPRVPMFDRIMLGTDYDASYRFHVDPARVFWTDMAMEVCDARPSFIDENPERWIEEVGPWCPFNVNSIDRVIDCR